MQLEYGTISRDFTKLPEATQRAIATSGFAHYLGNVVASKVVNQIRSAVAGADADAKTIKAVATSAVQAYRAEHAEVVQKWTSEAQAELLGAMDKGELGIRAVAVRVDPLTAATMFVAGQMVRAKLKKAGLKVPKGDDTVSINGTAYTFAQLVGRQISDPEHGKIVKNEAERKVREDARRAKQVEAVTGDTSGL